MRLQFKSIGRVPYTIHFKRDDRLGRETFSYEERRISACITWEDEVIRLVITDVTFAVLIFVFL